jgi:hypothetical protein
MSTDPQDWKRLSGPGRILRIELERLENELVLQITHSGDEHASERLRFRHARDVRFRGETTELVELATLMVRDVAADGWDGVRFHVRDYEEEVISFYCRAIERGADE